MKTENLIKASDSFEFFFKDIRAAHTDAINSGNEFAHIAFLDLIQDVAKVQVKLNSIKLAAKVN